MGVNMKAKTDLYSLPMRERLAELQSRRKRNEHRKDVLWEVALVAGCSAVLVFVVLGWGR